MFVLGLKFILTYLKVTSKDVLLSYLLIVDKNCNFMRWKVSTHLCNLYLPFNNSSVRKLFYRHVKKIGLKLKEVCSLSNLSCFKNSNCFVFHSYFSEQFKKTGWRIILKKFKGCDYEWFLITSVFQETVFIWEVFLPSFFCGEEWYIYFQYQKPETLLILVGKIAEIVYVVHLWKKQRRSAQY